jgi:hypothetical protein
VVVEAAEASAGRRGEGRRTVVIRWKTGEWGVSCNSQALRRGEVWRTAEDGQMGVGCSSQALGDEGWCRLRSQALGDGGRLMLH